MLRMQVTEGHGCCRLGTLLRNKDDELVQSQLPILWKAKNQQKTLPVMTEETYDKSYTECFMVLKSSSFRRCVEMSNVMKSTSEKS